MKHLANPLTALPILAAVKSESSHPQKEPLEEMLAGVQLQKEANLLHKQTATVDTVSSEKAKSELNISAEALLTMEADGAQIQTPVFIQPNSDQPCPLHINVAPYLNLQFLRANGQPLKSTADSTITE